MGDATGVHADETPLKVRVSGGEGGSDVLANHATAPLKIVSRYGESNITNMEIHFPPELEAKLAHSAAEQGREPDELVREIVAKWLDEQAHYVADVRAGEESFEKGNDLTQDQVGKRLEPFLQG